MQSIDNISILSSKLFRRSFFSDLAKGKDINYLFSDIDNDLFKGKNITFGDFFEILFDGLKRNYRNEYVYKSAIINKIVFGRHSPRSSSSAIELPINNSIVDVAVFNGFSTAYEIKTEFDTPKRLATQAFDYLDVFDKVYIVTHPSCAEKYAQINIPYVGVLSLSDKDRFSIIKEAEENTNNLKLDKMFSVLRKNEYINIIEHFTSVKLDMPNGIISDYCRDVYLKMPLSIARDYFISAMKKRTANNDFIDYLYSLPACLRALGYATPLSKKQKDYIVNLMDSKFGLY